MKNQENMETDLAFPFLEKKTGIKRIISKRAADICARKLLRSGLALRREFFINAKGIKPFVLEKVEGVKPKGKIWIKPLLEGEKLLILQGFREKGSIDSPHTHMDHDSVSYLVKGRLKLNIGGKEYIAEEGCAWYHPAGVEHSATALEDCLQIEVKAPPRRTWEDH